MKPISKKVHWFLAVALVIGLAAFSLYRVWTPTSGGTSAASSGPFRVAFNTWLGYSPLVIAKEKGFLKSRGIDAEFSILEGIGEKNAALIRGDVDGVGHSADSAVTSVASGVDGEVVFVFDKSLGADAILAKKAIGTIADLKGRKVALEPGFTGHFLFLSILREAGLTQSDVTIIPMDTGSAGGAFVAGQVDAAATWEPWIGKAKGMPDARVLISSADRPGLIIDVLFMNRSTIEARPNDVIKLIQAMGEATDWYNGHHEEGDRIIEKFWKLKPEEVRETLAGLKFTTLPENVDFFGTVDRPGQVLETIRMADELWQKAGVTKSRVEPRNLVDFKSVNAAAKGH